MTIPKHTYAFTDGASRGNPGPGGWGAVIVSPQKKTVTEIGGGEKNTTNNRMELKAIIETLKGTDTPITIFTDSQYVLKGATSWLHNWKKNGWKTQQKKDVLNDDLWKELDGLLEKSTVEWKKVSGHVGLPGNERADVIATHFADSKAIQLFKGPKSEYDIDVDHFDVDSSLLADRSKKRVRSSQKAYSYVSMVGGEIQTHKTWKETEARVKGHPALFRKSLSAEDEADIIRSFKSKA